MHEKQRKSSATEKVKREVVFGYQAAQAVFLKRREQIVRVAVQAQCRKDFASLLAFAENAKIPVEIVEERQLRDIATTDQHEGICLLVQERTYCTVRQLGERTSTGRQLIVALDRVRNPYNIGAIARTAAFFGADGLLLGAPAPNPGLSELAVRVAEGGCEYLHVARTTDLAESLGVLKKLGFTVVGAESNVAQTLARSSLLGPMVLVVGHEREGLSERTRKACDALVLIEGVDQVHSLNVSVATSILIAEWSRQNQASAKTLQARKSPS